MQCIKRVTFKNVASKKGCLYAGWMTANVLNSWGAWVRFPRNNELIKGLLKCNPDTNKIITFLRESTLTDLSQLILALCFPYSQMID